MKYYSTGSRPSQQSLTSGSRLGELPEIPAKDAESPPIPPGHPNNRNGYVNESFEGAYTEPIYSYCDAPFYQAPVPRDSHAYEGMQPLKIVANTTNTHTIQVDMLEVPREARRTTSNATEAYVDIIHHQTEYADDLDNFQPASVSVSAGSARKELAIKEEAESLTDTDDEFKVEEQLSVAEELEPADTKEDDSKQADENESTDASELAESTKAVKSTMLPRETERDTAPETNLSPPSTSHQPAKLTIDNGIYFDSSVVDTQSIASSSDDEYRDPCLTLAACSDRESNSSNLYHDLEHSDKESIEDGDGDTDLSISSEAESVKDVDETDDDTQYYNVTDIDLIASSVQGHSLVMEDNDLYGSIKSMGNLDTSSDTETQQNQTDNSSMTNTESDFKPVPKTRSYENLIIPVPKPRKSASSGRDPTQSEEESSTGTFAS